MPFGADEVAAHTRRAARLSAHRQRCGLQKDL